MKLHLLLKCLVIPVILGPAIAYAEVYMELSSSLIEIDTPSATTRPLMADIRVGYDIPEHQVELAVMTSIRDDSLNQLTVDVPSAISVLYHYLPFPDNSIQLHLIAGVSQVKIESSYPGTTGSSDSFYGASYGIGFEESFQSFPRLKLSIDWIQLYHGDRMDINATSLGVHYDF